MGIGIRKLGTSESWEEIKQKEWDQECWLWWLAASRESRNIKTVQTSCLTPVTDDTRPIRAQSSHRPMPAPHDTRRPERELAKTWASCPERWGQTKRLFPPEPDHEDTTFSWREISSPWPMWRPQNTEGLNLYSVLLFYQLMFKCLWLLKIPMASSREPVGSDLWHYNRVVSSQYPGFTLGCKVS